MSDKRLPLAVVDFRQLTTLEGRILVHGEGASLTARPPRRDVLRSGPRADTG